MARRASTTLVDRRLTFEHDLITRVEKLLIDPVRNKREYGALSHLVGNLLEEWLRKNHPPKPSTLDDL